MKPLTKQLIQKHLGNEDKITKTLFGWRVDLVSGASVKISKKGRIDFGKYRDPKNRKNINDALFQYEFRDSLALSNEIFGGVGLYGKCDRKDYIAVLEYAASEGFNTGDQGLILRHFGPEAKMKCGWHSYTVSLPNGSHMKFDCGAITKVSGDVLRKALEMVNEVAPDSVVVRGKAELLTMAFHVGRSMGIDVIPEDELKAFITLASNAVVVVCGLIAFQCFNVWLSLLIGYGVGVTLSMLAARLFWKNLRDASRKRGLDIVKADQPANQRKASMDNARSKGML